MYIKWIQQRGEIQSLPNSSPADTTGGDRRLFRWNLARGEADNPPQAPPQVTPLFLACYFQAWDSALLLLSRGADPHKAARSNVGNVLTPLFYAALHNSTAVCNSLLARGARIDQGACNTCFTISHHHHNHHTAIWLEF